MLNTDVNFDVEIIQRLHESDKGALTELYNAYWELLFISSFNILKDRELCEDIIQDVFLSLWKNRKKLKINVSLKSYLYASVRYQVFYQFRKNKGRVRVALFEELNSRVQYTSPESELMYKELLQQINLIVETLPEKCRRVYVLSREQQLSNREISNRLKISLKTVENHMTKALRVLRTSIDVLLVVGMLLYLF